ncbi:MAG: hypothetical protein SGPRY_013671, partial [Prymnesium sp.]
LIWQLCPLSCDACEGGEGGWNKFGGGGEGRREGEVRERKGEEAGAGEGRGGASRNRQVGGEQGLGSGGGERFSRDKGSADDEIFDWLRQLEPASLEPGVEPTSSKAYIAPSPLGGRGVFARRQLAAGEVVHVVRASHLVGQWGEAEVLSKGAVRRVVQLLREEGGIRSYTRLLPLHSDLYALPELWEEEELSWLQDESITRIARDVPPALSELRDALSKEGEWHPPLSIQEVSRARGLLQSRPLAIGARATFSLVPFVDMINTKLVPGAHINVKLSSLKTPPQSPHPPVAIVAATRDISEGEELFLDYGLNLHRTTTTFALLNYGIIGHVETDTFHPQSLRHDAKGSLICQPLWCSDELPTYNATTATQHASIFPQRIRLLEDRLSSSPWNATSLDQDEAELLDARNERRALELETKKACSSEDPMSSLLLRSRRRVLALEYRLGCKLGAVSAVHIMRSFLQHEATTSN